MLTRGGSDDMLHAIGLAASDDNRSLAATGEQVVLTSMLRASRSLHARRSSQMARKLFQKLESILVSTTRNSFALSVLPAAGAPGTAWLESMDAQLQGSAGLDGFTSGRWITGGGPLVLPTRRMAQRAVRASSLDMHIALRRLAAYQVAAAACASELGPVHSPVAARNARVGALLV